MNMYTDYEIRQLPLTIKSNRLKVERFLAANGLRMDEMNYYAAVFSCGQDEILAGGGLCRDTIKCVAVDRRMRDEAFTNRLVSHLISTAASDGYASVKVFTKPENIRIFESLGFVLLAEAAEAVFMENGQRGMGAYRKYLESLRLNGRNGIIVMNANPFTKGHRYLIEQAARQVDNLYVIAVKEDRSQFGYSERLAMIQAGCRNLGNVTVCEGSDYAVSAATFPSYFLKTLDTASDTQMSLDLDLFARHIAPALKADVRFVGSEPEDRLTARYNEMMKSLLPPKGIRVTEIERLKDGQSVVSASSLRRFLAEGQLKKAISTAWSSTVPYLISWAAADAIRQELDTTPKPGLVDRQNSGAHNDMDWALMSGSIDILHPYFTQLAQLGYNATLPSAEEVRKIGIEAENAMLRFTCGVNTYKGALFAIGLAVTAAAHLYFTEGGIRGEESIRRKIAAIASGFTATEGTHGSSVTGKYRVNGALANACEAYPQLFGDWLPFFRRHREDSYARHKTLLRIMSTLEDTNIYFRKGAETAARVKKEAAFLLENFSVEALEEMDRNFTGENISPGGCADMLPLTIFIDTIL